MHTITTSDDVSLRCTDEGTGPNVVLLGGFAMGASGWTRQRQALSVDHRVVAVDRRSHGESEHVTRGQRMARSALDLAEALEVL
ncbi:MAG: non-heme chloroperoxidase, partial [Glaciecola sp.]